MQPTSSSPKLSDCGKKYFFNITPKKWNFREAYILYQDLLTISPSAICDMMERDLNLVNNYKKYPKEAISAMLVDIKFTAQLLGNQQQQTSSQPQSQLIVTDHMTDNFNHCNNLTKNIYQNTLTKKRPNETKADDMEPDIESSTINSGASLLLKKAKKVYNFHPPHLTPSISANKPRINDDDGNTLDDIFVVMIDQDGSSLNSTRREYDKNMEEQRVLHCLNKTLMDFLDQCLDGTVDQLLEYLDQNTTLDENQTIRLVRYILYDYHANCTKPSYVTIPNERTPFAECIIPIFKYFSAATGLLSFIWCEKSSPSNKQLMLCLSQSQRKLFDGIGFSCKDRIERLLMECSGEEDGQHTEEDTLKLMEYTSNCLKNEMNQYRNASWTTFGQRRIFAAQCIGNKLTLLSTSRMGIGKWCFVEVRSAIVPRNWEDRYYLYRLMELLMKLKNMLIEQEQVTMELKRQQSGRLTVDPKDTIEVVNRSCQENNNK